METTIVILIVGAAVIYCGKNTIKKFKGKSACACEGTCCSGETNCGILLNSKPKIANGKLE
ncbi:MAG: FeoB-associated Cys-rich membrane protein [Desulfobacterales bacterium]|nr:FeoB-associated Cys-rich membrane protein [Desulfobacterales bacterium]